MTYNKLTLKPSKDYPIRSGHLWCFSGAIQSSVKGLTDGEIVQLLSSDGKYIATGYYSANGSIAVKILSRSLEAIDINFFVGRLHHALNLRQSLGLVASNSTTAFRLVNGEGDWLPGLIIDIYGRTAVMQCQTRGILNLRMLIAEALQKVVGKHLDSIYLKASSDCEVPSSYLFGVCGDTQIKENDLCFSIDWEKGQKTGFFLDQRVNRALVRELAYGKRVLNAFCYTGGFSIAALVGGAISVESIDCSESALNMLAKNLALNDLHDRHSSLCTDFMKYVEQTSIEANLIVLDPPAFVKHKAALNSGLKGYAKLHLNTFRALCQESLLLTFSCSQLVSAAQFKDAVKESAQRAGKNVQILHELHQSPCHPVNLFHPESSYLKGLLLRAC